MEHKDDIEISCNDILLLFYESGEEIRYNYSYKSDVKKIDSQDALNGASGVQNKKIDILILTKNKKGIRQYTSALNGHKMFAVKDKCGVVIFLEPNKNRYHTVKTCRLTTPINENGWFMSSKQNFLMTIRDRFRRLVFVYNTPNVMNGYELLKPEEEKVIDKLLTSQHITANDILKAKEIITKYNAETARRYELLLKNISMLKHKEKLAKQQKEKAEKIERKKQLKIDRQKSKIIAKCIEKIAEK